VFSSSRSCRILRKSKSNCFMVDDPTRGTIPPAVSQAYSISTGRLSRKRKKYKSTIASLRNQASNIRSLISSTNSNIGYSPISDHLEIACFLTPTPKTGHHQPSASLSPLIQREKHRRRHCCPFPLQQESTTISSAKASHTSTISSTGSSRYH
jgi:hypothetical protein